MDSLALVKDVAVVYMLWVHKARLLGNNENWEAV